MLETQSLQNPDSMSMNDLQEKMGSFEDVMNQKKIKEWDRIEVGEFLEKIGLGSYKSIFFDNYISGTDLLKMTD